MDIEQETYRKIKPLLENYTEGLFWDFKKTFRKDQIPEIIKDILAFSNSDYEGDSYIIIGVGEISNNDKEKQTKIKLDTEDRRRLNTDANYIYLNNKWDVHGLSEEDLNNMKQFSASILDQLSSSMLISQPKLEFIPICINSSRWLYVIVIKKIPGVFITKNDIVSPYDKNKIIVKQGVLYVRITDITLGAKTDAAMATEHIRV